jgi:Transposase DDE domain group 1
MATEWNTELFDFAPVERRAVVAGFDGGAVTTDAGGLSLGVTDRRLGLIERFAACFIDRRRPELIEHGVAMLIGQRVFSIALGYEGRNQPVRRCRKPRDSLHFHLSTEGPRRGEVKVAEWGEVKLAAARASRSSLIETTVAHSPAASRRPLPNRAPNWRGEARRGSNAPTALD